MSKEHIIPIGARFGRLVVDSPPEYRDCGISKHGKYEYRRIKKFYRCSCDCGEKKIVEGGKLLCGDVSSCGCKRREMYERNRRYNTSFGSWDTPLFKVWNGMIRRCHSPKAPNRKYYYDRGISVCKLWRDDFSAFERWSIDNGYKQGLQIDRINVNGNYEPSNCRWITPKDNSHNRRNHIEIIYKGKKRRLVDVMDEVGCTIDEHTVWKRIFLHKWDVERALTESKHFAGKKGKIVINYKGEKLTIKEISRLTGLAPSAIRNRLFKQNMDVEQVFSVPRKTHKRRDNRISQLVVASVTECEPIEVQAVSDTERGTGGFGSTGK